MRPKSPALTGPPSPMRAPGLWPDLTWPEVGALSESGAVAFLPVGSTEQHGRHLPVGTDLHIAEELAAAAAVRVGRPCVVLPGIWAGCSRHHSGFPGWISLTPALLTQVVVEVLRSLASQGFRTVCMINGHYGNTAALRSAVSQAYEEFEARVLLVNYWDVISEELARVVNEHELGPGHAGEMETSIQLALEPTRIRAEEEAAAVFVEPPKEPPGLICHRPFHTFTSTGHIGDPRAATAEKGRALLLAAAEKVALAVRDFAAEAAGRGGPTNEEAGR